ncbi:zinc finger protein 205 [Caerostris extrusa]|uniref:Zinc finger protein 205 n=1 Tax=Caerostris extrusa TaxID=172846 RepID=A0AAV4WTK6_CAEEX|nr:zinc finger protein 205 [Caerostris extrusa]
MYEIYSEVRAIISTNVVSAIEGCVFDAIQERIFTAKVEQVTAENEIQYHLSGTLDGILIAKTKLEEMLNNIKIKRMAKESNELDSTTLSEENSSVADEGNTSYDKEVKERPRTSQRTRSARLALQLRTLKKKSILRSRPQRPSRTLHTDPDRLVENLQQMKLATEDSDLDSAGTDGKNKTYGRLPCKTKKL